MFRGKLPGFVQTVHCPYSLGSIIRDDGLMSFLEIICLPDADFMVVELKIAEDLVKNNFPKSIILRASPVVPARQMVIKDNLHVFKEIIGTFFPVS
jgi:hypothetical protein